MDDTVTSFSEEVNDQHRTHMITKDACVTIAKDKDDLCWIDDFKVALDYEEAIEFVHDEIQNQSKELEEVRFVLKNMGYTHELDNAFFHISFVNPRKPEIEVKKDLFKLVKQLKGKTTSDYEDTPIVKYGGIGILCHRSSMFIRFLNRYKHRIQKWPPY